MSCPACTTAESDPTRGGLYHAACMSCQARMLANSPRAARAMAGDAAELQAAIASIWQDDYAAGRAAVWEWIERINHRKAGA